MATARFLPDKADHRERVDALCAGGLAAPDRSMGVGAGQVAGSAPVLGDGRFTVTEARDFPRVLPPLPFPDFAGHRHRELIDDMHVPGNLVVRQLPGTK